jgi:hypothetical protein
MAPRKSNGTGRRSMLPVYGAYNFKTQDPQINVLRTLVEDHFGHRVTHHDLKVIHDAGGPSVGCMQGWWLKGTTLRPTNPTIEATGRAIGYERVWRRMK